MEYTLGSLDGGECSYFVTRRQSPAVTVANEHKLPIPPPHLLRCHNQYPVPPSVQPFTSPTHPPPLPGDTQELPFTTTAEQESGRGVVPSQAVFPTW